MDNIKSRGLLRQGATINLIFVFVFLVIGTFLLVVNANIDSSQLWSYLIFISVFFLLPIASLIINILVLYNKYPSKGLMLSGAIFGIVLGIIGGIMMLVAMSSEAPKTQAS